MGNRNLVSVVVVVVVTVWVGQQIFFVLCKY